MNRISQTQNTSNITGGIVMAQMNVVAADPARNFETLARMAREVAESGGECVVFPELCISGYLVGDTFFDPAFVTDVMSYHADINALSQELSIAIVYGSLATTPGLAENGMTTRLYNAVYAVQNGVSLISHPWYGDFTPKTNLPNYSIFDDKRYFRSPKDDALERGLTLDQLADLYTPIELCMRDTQRKVGLVICEDMWDDEYTTKPIKYLKNNGAEVIVNISASPYGLGKESIRDAIVARQSLGVTMHYLNHVGQQNNGKNIIPFDGRSVIYQDGVKIMQAPTHVEWVYGVDHGIESDLDETESLRQTLVLSIRAFMAQINKKKLIIGLSWGVDSAVVAALAVEALGAANVITINMPTIHNTGTTRSLAADIASRLGVRYEIVPIQDLIDIQISTIEKLTGRPIARTGKNTVSYENIQARTRSGAILSLIVSEEDAVFTNNGNKVEAYEGYATLYGDVAGAFAPLGDLLKRQVRAIGSLYVTEWKLPNAVITLKPSAELSENQDVEKWLGDPFDYDFQDALVSYLEDYGKNPEDVLRAYQSGTLKSDLWLSRDIVGIDGYFSTSQAFITHLEATWRRHHISVFKAIQSPPNIKISRRARGYDHRESQIGWQSTRKYQRLVTEILTLKTSK